jgi:hypothetical protein
MTDTALPAAEYWGQRFQQMHDEVIRIAKPNYGSTEPLKAKKTDTWWQWFTTEANIFSTLETANDGVYWRLEIDSNGKAHTDRT